MTGWDTAGLILGICVLALAMPREDVLLIPERRDWLATLRRFMPKARQRAEEAGQREADEYVAALRAEEPASLVIRWSELPSATATVEVKQLGTGEIAPWGPAPDPAAQPAQEEAPQRPKRDAPTIVMEAVRPEIERDLRPYLDGMPSYED